MVPGTQKLLTKCLLKIMNEWEEVQKTSILQGKVRGQKQTPGGRTETSFFLYDLHSALASVRSAQEIHCNWCIYSFARTGRACPGCQKRVLPPGGNADQIPGFSGPNPWLLTDSRGPPNAILDHQIQHSLPANSLISDSHLSSFTSQTYNRHSSLKSHTETHSINKNSGLSQGKGRRKLLLALGSFLGIFPTIFF